MDGFCTWCAGLADAVRNLTGWPRTLVAFLAGLVSALGFAPFGLFPVFLIALGVFVLLIDGAVFQRRPFVSVIWVGWCWGFGQFLAGLYWVGYAFLVDAPGHAWQIPFVELLLPGGLALFMALVAGLSFLLWSDGPARLYGFTAIYAGTEWLRGHVLTGFPWNLPAYVWGPAAGVLQVASVIGAYGLSLLTILFGASLALVASRGRDRQLILGMALLFTTLWVGGALRLWLVQPPDVPGVELRLVQPDIAQKDKYVRSLRLQNWRRLLDLSEAPPAGPAPTHIIWPEGAPPFLLQRMPAAIEDITEMLGAKDILMTGAVRVYISPDNALRAANSLYVFGPGGVVLGTYDKAHLVPFGEYLPLSSWLARIGLSQLVNGPEGFVSGPGPKRLMAPGVPAFGPLICYEIIFPGAVVGDQRPGWFVNVTDDSWFGPSTGPYQHLLTARVRAIEEGIPIARDANTGISAVIDPLGRIRAELGLEKMGVVDSPLPSALPPTPYSRIGDRGFWLLLGACLIMAILGRVRKSFSQPSD
jgi:apolipoprotein N-acyltransferase